MANNPYQRKEHLVTYIHVSCIVNSTMDSSDYKNFITYPKNFLRICASQMSAFSLLCQTEKAGKFCFLVYFCLKDPR